MKIKKERLMSIDPSINNLGIAIWDINEKKLLFYRLLHPTKEYRVNEFDKSWSMYQEVRSWIRVYFVNRVIMEIPEHWAVAGFEAREKGSMTKLMFVCGILYSLKDILDEFELVVPRKWKGQLPKDVVANRLYEQYLPMNIDLRKINNNVLDAIAIGHYKLYGGI